MDAKQKNSLIAFAKTKAEEVLTKNAVIYTRVSSKEQAVYTTLSTQGQTWGPLAFIHASPIPE